MAEQRALERSRRHARIRHQCDGVRDAGEAETRRLVGIHVREGAHRVRRARPYADGADRGLEVRATHARMADADAVAGRDSEIARRLLREHDPVARDRPRGRDRAPAPGRDRRAPARGRRAARSGGLGLERQARLGPLHTGRGGERADDGTVARLEAVEGDLEPVRAARERRRLLRGRRCRPPSRPCPGRRRRRS